MNIQLPDLPNTGMTLDFATELVTLAGTEPPPEVRNQVDLLLIDYLGTALRGTTVPWGAAAAGRTTRYAGTGSALVFGNGEKTSPEVASFANAVAAHGMELDDTHDPSISHPGAAVFSAALAVAAETKPTMQQFRSAVVAGYEAMARVGMATDASQVIQHGFHPTALFGGFGASTAAAILHGFGAEQLARAWGLMLSSIGGSMQFSEDPLGTTVKRLHAAYGVRAGVSAVELAVVGMAGPVDALTGRYGFCRIFGSDPDFAVLKSRVDSTPEIMRISIKPYPCCRLFHSTLDAIGELTDGFSLPVSEIEKIVVGGSTIVVTQHMVRRPTSVMAAQYNLPHIMAAALTYGPSAYEGYTEDKLAEPRLLDLSDRVDAFVSDEMNALFPARCGSDVTLHLKDGRKLHTVVNDSIGTPMRPMTVADVRSKLLGLCPEAEAQAALDEIENVLSSEGAQQFQNLTHAISDLVASQLTKEKD